MWSEDHSRIAVRTVRVVLSGNSQIFWTFRNLPVIQLREKDSHVLFYGVLNLVLDWILERQNWVPMFLSAPMKRMTAWNVAPWQHLAAPSLTSFSKGPLHLKAGDLSLCGPSPDLSFCCVFFDCKWNGKSQLPYVDGQLEPSYCLLLTFGLCSILDLTIVNKSQHY
jgi:hypothetical protein